MDYQRIYDEFIADRRAREPAVYRGQRLHPRKELDRDGLGDPDFVHHHILPKACGGDVDDANNLIAITNGDHLFAHALLARIHGSNMWRAYFAMLSGIHDEAMRGKKYSCAKTRRAYETARKNTWSDEDIAKMKEAQAAVWTPEKRAEHGELSRQVQQCPEFKARHSEGMRRAWQDEERKAEHGKKISKARKQMSKQISAAGKAAWAKDDGTRKAQITALAKSPKNNAAVSKATKARWAAQRQPIICLDNGQIFPCQYAALDWQHEHGKRPLKSIQDIVNVCRGKGKSAGGFRWAYAEVEEAEQD